MTDTASRGADALTAALAEAGTRRMFTLSGNHIMPVFDAAPGAGIELIHTRHEAATVHMADAWARLTGEVGVALVTGGPGHANAISALYTASMAESPVLLLSGHAPTNELGMGAFQEMRQAELAAPLCKASWTVRSARALGVDVARALHLAASGRPGPVHLSLPVDLLEQVCDASGPAAMPRPDSPPPAIKAAAEQALGMLAQARRPLVLAGPACLHSSLRSRLSELEHALGLPVIGMESPRGTNDPALGSFATLLARADLVLLLCKRLDFTLRFGAPGVLGADCKFIQFDPEREEMERSQRQLASRLAASAVADPVQAMEALCAAAGATVVSAAWADEVRQALAWRAPWTPSAPGSPMHPAQVLAPLQALLDSDRDAVLVSDGGEFGQWAQACLRAPHRVVNGVAGAIGAGLSFALAARLAHPQAPVVAALGDGTFGFHSSEIDTGVRYGLPFLAVVGNDARWNAEYQIQLRQYGRERAHGCTLLPTRYDQVAAGFGGYGELVTDPAEVLPAAHRALQSGLPAVLNVMMEGHPAPAAKPPAPAAQGKA